MGPSQGWAYGIVGSHLFNLKIDLIFHDSTTASSSTNRKDKSTDEIDRSKIHEAKRYDDIWVLKTNYGTIRLENTACGYRGLMLMECCFQSLIGIAETGNALHR